MTFLNPATERACYRPCKSCLRCADNGRFSACASCSGRNDPMRRRLPDPDDVCSCAEGILRYVTQQGRRIVAKYQGNPYGGSVRADTPTQDEIDYNNYLAEERERQDNESWDPIQFTGGGSTNQWFQQHRQGLG